MNQHEIGPTRQYLSQFSAPSRLEVTIPGTRRAVDGAVWRQGRAGSFTGADLLLVQTKRWLTSSVLGQALLSAELALDAGAERARCVALVGEGQEELEHLARQSPFVELVEVVVAPELFDGGSYPGAPAWSQRAVLEWLDGVDAEQKVAMYDGAERRARGYDRACAVISRGPIRVVVNTQKHLGMSVLGRAIVSQRLLARGDALTRSAVVARRSAADLVGLAARHGVLVEAADDGGAQHLVDRAVAPIRQALDAALQEASSSPRLLRDRPFADGGVEDHHLASRLNRAAQNHIEGSDATTSRYGIWAVTCRDHVAEAVAQLDARNPEAARTLLVKAANSLTAFAEVQRLLDPMGIGRNDGE